MRTPIYIYIHIKWVSTLDKDMHVVAPLASFWPPRLSVCLWHVCGGATQKVMMWWGG